MWSGAMVFFDSFSQISFAWEEIMWMNSVPRTQGVNDIRRAAPALGEQPNHLHNTR
jgi:hypothetical protein